MAGTCCWMEKCTICSGKGKIQTWDKKAKKLSNSETCPGCEGRGYIMIRKSILRKKV